MDPAGAPFELPDFRPRGDDAGPRDACENQCSLLSDGFAFQLSPAPSDPFPCLAVELEQQARALEDDWLCPDEPTPTSSFRGPAACKGDEMFEACSMGGARILSGLDAGPDGAERGAAPATGSPRAGKRGSDLIFEESPYGLAGGSAYPALPASSRPCSPVGADPPTKRLRSEEDTGSLVSTPRQGPAEGPSPLMAMRRVRVGASRPTPVRISPPAHPAPRTPAAMPPPAITERPPRRAASAAAAATTAAVLRRSRRAGVKPLAGGEAAAAPSDVAQPAPDAAVASIPSHPTEEAVASDASAMQMAGRAAPTDAAPCAGQAEPAAASPPVALAVAPAGPAARRGQVTWNSTLTMDPRSGEQVTSVSPATFCSQCGATSTPVWRAGPFGHKTLCNACGVRWMKVAKKERKVATAAAANAHAAAAGAAAVATAHAPSAAAVHAAAAS